jgi:hypothetical protein
LGEGGYGSVCITMRNLIVALAVMAAVLIAAPGAAPPPAPAGTVLDETITPGRNHDKTEFRLWLPHDLGDLKAKTFQAVGEDKVWNYPTAWLPTARVAERWQWLVPEKP